MMLKLIYTSQLFLENKLHLHTTSNPTIARTPKITAVITMAANIPTFHPENINKKSTDRVLET